jgi:glycosyltransferase involved in cell wall biosynthesis
MKEKILFIGLVDINKIKGDSNHFKKLTAYMEDYFDIFIISFTKCDNKKHFKINFPKNKVIRLFYWNVHVFKLIYINHKKNNIKKIYFRESGFLLSPYLASFLFGIKLYVEINGVIADDLPIPKKIIHYFFKNIYKLGFKFIASKGYAQLLQNNFEVPNHKIHIVSLGLDILPQKMSSLNSKFVNKTIVFIGNIVEYQGLDLFIDGFNIFVRNIDNSTNLLIIGEGKQKEFLLNKVLKLNLENNVSFVSPISSTELNDLLKKCHLGISTFSQKRGKPYTISALKTYDYINAKLPILTSDMDEMSEFIKEENIGEVICNYVPLEYCDKISKCLSNNFAENTAAIYDIKLNEWTDKFSWNTRFNSIKNLINS